jgi:hypothetical protein
MPQRLTARAVSFIGAKRTFDKAAKRLWVNRHLYLTLIQTLPTLKASHVFVGIDEDADRNGRELPRGRLPSALSSPGILLANHAAPCRQALGRMLLHPLGELRRAHQAGLHRDVSEV